VTDYACEDCGYDGPHTVVANDGATATVECGSCSREFTVPSGVIVTTT